MTITGKKIDRILQTDMSKIFQLRVSCKEFDALNRSDRKVRYKYVMKRIADTETLWTMSKDEMTIAVQIQDGVGLFSVWSSREYGIAFCEKMCSDFSCLPISLDDFVEYFIDFICDEDLLINVFPTVKEPIGKVVDVNEFAERLSKELEDYQ